MGLPLARLVAVCLVLALAMGSELQKEARSRNHVCSTWGDFHYKTFDGDVFRFPGLCDYNFASDCRDSYKEFAVHLKRGLGEAGGHSQIESVLITIKDDTIYLTHKLAVVNGAMVSTPHYSSGLLIEKNDAYTKVYSRAGLSLMWNREDALMVELDSRFQNHTCGLCGDFNGMQTQNEFLSDGVHFSAIEFGNMQKINKPGVECGDPEVVQEPESCSEHRAECERLLTSTAFEDCQARVPVELYVQACMQDRCHCPQGGACECSTLAEFSRQCSHTGGRPENWRTASLCPKKCPGNMVYLESSSPCVDTCSHLEVSSLCEEHYMDGCFCPEGTVYDDITGSGCIPVSQCHCKLHGHLYMPGQEITNDCEQCVCNAGRWTCEDLPCPETCALEGGSHITTFDGKKFTFHGDCYYVLTKSEHNDSYALLGELASCGSTDKQTCLKTVVLLTDNKKNVVAFKSGGSVLLNEMEVTLPHVAASFSIFRPSSYHIVVNTMFGLRLQIQLVPVMQLFVTLDQSAQGQVQGLCGNFNGLESDDFMTSGGMVEATGAGFANTWKAQSSCHDKLDWLDDPCSLNIESANYAEHWCSLLKRSETPFARCHLAVDPTEYYKRCKYDTCNCQNNEDCMCAALSSYARACAAKGVMLWGWRERVCNKDVHACPSSQIFMYNLTTCQQTCRSLSEGDTHCLKGFAPVEGCGCPDHTFMDEKGRCVPLAKCSCYHHGLYLEAGDVILRQEERCTCRNGRLQCTQVKLIGHTCPEHKILVDCNNLTALATRKPRATSCQTLVAGYYHTECVSGCVCPDGLLDDGRGKCVEEDECPCIHNKQLYSSGQGIKLDCNNTCTCQKGRWECTRYACHSTCSIYGSGHYITFDGKHYDFDGHCSYVAVQDYCGQNSTGSFSIITENVPCGTTGVTCSKAIKIFIGGTELKLVDKHRVVKELEEGHHVPYITREVGLYLVVEASSGIIVIWDKKTTIFIKLDPSYKGTVCGLCGNFDDQTKNDFTTRDHMVVTSELDFGNSWKEASTCPDVSHNPDPCSLNPHRRSWAEKQCSIIKSDVFKVCHSKVDPTVFYEACVHDSCSCDTGGDCECFCSAVASYAQECTKAEACVFWRTPDLCRCYPRCPEDRPIYDEDRKRCITGDKCGCYIGDTRYETNSSIPTDEICMSCICTNTSEIICRPDVGKVINETQDGIFCYKEFCGPNGTVEQQFYICGSSTPIPSTVTSFTTISIPISTTPISTTITTTTATATTTRVPVCCFWSDWINENHPVSGPGGGDRETFDHVCSAPEDIECRAATEPKLSWEELGQKVQFTPSPTPITTQTSTLTPVSETTTPIPTTETSTPKYTTPQTPSPPPTSTVTPTTTPTTTIKETPTPTNTVPTTGSTSSKPPTESLTPVTSQSTPFPPTESTTLSSTPVTTTATSTTASSPGTTSSFVTSSVGSTPPSPPGSTPGPTTSSGTPTSPKTTTGTTSPTTRPPSTSTPTSPTVPTSTMETITQTRLSPTTPTTLKTTRTSSWGTLSSASPITSPITETIVTCCVVDEMFYGPGELVYNNTYGDTCYFVNCSVDCQLQVFNWSCPSTPSTPTPSTPTTPTPPKTTTPSTPSTTSSKSTPSTPQSTSSVSTLSTPTKTTTYGCLDFDPPRQVNETWWLCNCTMAICKHDNVVEIVELECNPPPMPTCSNGLKPVRVPDPDGCCWHWECDCYCTGWGDPHFVTFDGLYYSYQGNCTYVLVEEITPTVDNFGVYIDNYHCVANDKVSCPRTLIVRHETQEVKIKTLNIMPIEVEVQVNKQLVALPYKKYGLEVYESGINFVVDIPRLGAQVSYNGMSFSIRLPYRLFGNNTKGQCGTCTNNTSDDCILPSGKIISDCEIAADEWLVNDPSKPHCPHKGLTTKRPAITTPGISFNNCTVSPVCQLIIDSLFSQCHPLVPPKHYYEACLFDSCFVAGSGIECASVQAYAALCAQEGVCIDWRNHTQEVCPVKCPPHRQYQACGPAEEPTCQSSSSENSTLLVEGCFCPEGTTKFAPGYDVCVKTCGCVGPDSVPREFGEHFEFDCKDCVCLEGGSGIVCQPKKCIGDNLTTCEEDGTYLAAEANPDDKCCNITSCKCDTKLCKAERPSCLLGFEAKSEHVPGKCCPVYSCVPKGVCVHQNAEYQPGSPVYSDKCQDCVCTNTMDNSTQLNIISCIHVPCNISCSSGFELVEVPGECCKKCQQTHCIIEKTKDQYLILKPGEIQKNPNDKCTFFSCVQINNQLISSVSNITCPDFSPSDCVPGSITYMPNGCCQTCIPNQTRNRCSAITVMKEISYNGCTKNISMNFCSGSCGTFAMYSAQAQDLDHRCSCCKEERTSVQEVTLECPDGSELSHTYTHIESCQCQDTVCELPQAQQVRARRSSPRLLGGK
ncbi:mucin-2 [Grammomys surdaster]|uniref:mucin-2 n=1 Tax=Grammomys surdaster TaxID=491861 RepID=UPI0010A04D59|nr:mucin-2 [Grammomys surdaster]